MFPLRELDCGEGEQALHLEEDSGPGREVGEVWKAGVCEKGSLQWDFSLDPTKADQVVFVVKDLFLVSSVFVAQLQLALNPLALVK